MGKDSVEEKVTKGVVVSYLVFNILAFVVAYGFLVVSAKSTLLIALTILFAITSAVTTLDKRLIQAKRAGDLPPDEPMLPVWTGLVTWIHWGVALSLLVLKWKYAIVVFVVGFVLEVLPVLETVGNVLMAPFRPKEKSISKKD